MTISGSGLLLNYKLYYTFQGHEENGVSWHDSKDFETVNSQFTCKDFNEILNKMDEFYYDFRKKELNKLQKHSGLNTGVDLSLIAIITSLSLGLKKAGNELVVEPSKKATKFEPSFPVRREEPWKEIEDIAKKNKRWIFIFPRRSYIFDNRWNGFIYLQQGKNKIYIIRGGSRGCQTSHATDVKIADLQPKF